jgi:hypothetical protein
MRKLITAAGIAASALTLGLLSAAPATASTPDPAVWVGSPVNGTWPNTAGCAGATYPSPPNGDCSLPTVHHITYYSTFDWGTTIDDWASDDQGVVPGERVMLYAAPVNSGYTVSAHIDAVGPACASLLISDGGYRVTVGIYAGSTKIGTVTYAHINPTVSQGQWVSRWGTQIGTVGSGYNTRDKCWTAPHVHIEMASRHNYSCFSKIFLKYPGVRLSETNFQGYLGGDYASGPRRACP